MTDTASLAAALRPIAGDRVAARLVEGRARIVLDVTGLAPDAAQAMEEALLAAARGLPGVMRADLLRTSERPRRRLIAVASGKGGVGKSTVSANLAVALARAGRRIGLVDADIHGPSQPRLLGVEGVRPEAREKTLIPVATPWGVPLLSMGGLVEPGRAIAWRGSMAGSALGTLVDGDWGAVDTLLLDLPPGTGDLQLTMVQKHKPAGAIIVSTPQDLALIDATRAIDLFDKTGVPIVGVIENMAGYVCPHCGELSDPFGRGGAEATARELGLPFLGRVPLSLDTRERSDAGRPPAADEGERVFAGLAARLGEWLDAH